MSASLTYGSFGDIITTIQLLSQLAQALNEARGSRREFQDMVGELRLLQTTLSELMRFWQTRSPGPELDALADIITPTAADCRSTIEAFVERALEKYGRRLLRPVQSKKGLADVARMIQWHLCESSEVEKLRAKISRAMDTVQLVQTRAQGIVQEQQGDIIIDRLKLLEQAESQTADTITARFDEMIEKLEEHARANKAKMDTIASAISSTSMNVLGIQGSVTTIQKDLSMLAPLMASLSIYTQNTVHIEDSLGATFAIPLDIVRSWETLESIIRDRFLDRPGRELVRLQRYVLHDNLTGVDICRDRPFCIAAHPGRRLNMSMIFHAEWTGTQESTCPRCGRKSMSMEDDLDITCTNRRCGLIYRRVLDVSDLDEDHIDKMVSGPVTLRYRARPDQGMRDTENLHFPTCFSGDWLDSISTTEGPEIFKRVRFLSNWEDLPESRGYLFATFGDAKFWSLGHNSYGNAAYEQIMLSLVVQGFKFQSYIYDKNPWRLPKHNIRYGLWLFLGFVGRSKSQSVPAIVVYSESKRRRQRAYRVFEQLPWLRAGSRFILATASGPAFGTEEDFQLAREKYRECQDDISTKALGLLKSEVRGVKEV